MGLQDRGHQAAVAASHIDDGFEMAKRIGLEHRLNVRRERGDRLVEERAKLGMRGPVLPHTDAENMIESGFAGFDGVHDAAPRPVAFVVETDITDLESCANCLRAAVDAFGVLHGMRGRGRAGSGSGLS
jgi:hypothetical protein